MVLPRFFPLNLAVGAPLCFVVLALFEPLFSNKQQLVLITIFVLFDLAFSFNTWLMAFNFYWGLLSSLPVFQKIAPMNSALILFPACVNMILGSVLMGYTTAKVVVKKTKLRERLVFISFPSRKPMLAYRCRIALRKLLNRNPSSTSLSK